MNFDYSEEQTLIKDSIARYLQKDYPFDARREIARSETGYSKQHWQQFSELGWLAIPFAEELGGFGGNAIDDVIIMEELGKGLALEPYLATVILFGGLLASSADAAQHEQLITGIVDGSLQGALAYTEVQSRYALDDLQTTAALNGTDYVLNGEKIAVANGHTANRIIVSARTAGSPIDRNGITLFCIDANAKGVDRESYAMMDGHRVANIKLSNVTVGSNQIIGELHHGYALLANTIQRGTVAACAEALGIMEKLLQTTVAYAQTRKQFGVAIGSFQALQHRLVDMFIACEQTRSLLLRTACASSKAHAEIEPGKRSELLALAAKDAAALKAMVSDAGKLVGDEALQMHGGIGMTDELDVGHYVKRLMRINAQFGDYDHALRDYASQVFG
ncbi:MAG: pimeloyl-CoA dehydrogenase small subunit [Pseudomonadales bacterium]|nr:acyl-CoA dehydrogenase family protein [Gammaproteobacteria bacterium]NNL57210.1 pimeloyl-CoA dehydrogenase small subunit [Pseudomonadales bacterium]